MLSVVKLVGHGLVYRCSYRMSGWIGGITAVNGNGFVFHYLPAVQKKFVILPECPNTPKAIKCSIHTNIE